MGRALSICLFLLVALVGPTRAENRLERDLGRAEVRVRSASVPLRAGLDVADSGLAERLERMGYARKSSRPESPGQFFWGHEVFWIFQRAHERDGTFYREQLFGLRLDEQRRVVDVEFADGRRVPLRAGSLWIEPLVLSESLAHDRAERRPIQLDATPEIVWRAVLAAEDARFFRHTGVDGRSLARAMLANARAGKVVQGGSTITQQLVKNRALTPERTLTRKANEAFRALVLESEYEKEEILEAYLNSVYMGHVDGLAIHGFGAAAHVLFSKTVDQLDLDQAAVLAAMIQGPNRLSPIKNPDRVRERRNWVIDRLAELEWIDADRQSAAKKRPIRIKRGRVGARPSRHFLRWVTSTVESNHASRIERDLGVVVETTLDPMVQAWAEKAVSDHLGRLRSRYSRLRRAPLSAALVALDAKTGAVRAYVGGDPSAKDEFDRVRMAQRQPGSIVKPLILLEAFDACGAQSPIHPAQFVSDARISIQRDSKSWTPANFDSKNHGDVTVRESLVNSYNLPFVRIARHCGWEATADRLRKMGLSIPSPAPPAFALGAIEATPLQIAEAYTSFSTLGRQVTAYGIQTIKKPSGGTLASSRRRSSRVSRASSAFLVRGLMRDAVENGTGRSARVRGHQVVGKTGTSSGLRDAWFAGQSGGLVTVVWVGLDEGRLGLTGSAGAAPLWRDFMQRAVSAYPAGEPKRPVGVVTRTIDPVTGYRERGGEEELFRRGVVPKRKRFWRRERKEVLQ